MPGEGARAATGVASASAGAASAGGLVLGSASPRRRNLLAQIGVVPDAVIPAEIDETPRQRELPRAYARRMAAEKCDAIAAMLGAGAPGSATAIGDPRLATGASSPPGDGRVGGLPPAGQDAPVILTADTVVSVGRRILGKPADAAEAARFLLLLSGRRHRVTTAVCLRHGERLAGRTVETRVQVKRLSDEELSAYLRSDEWRGKAGGYAIQGLFGAFIPAINGSYTNVVGLPLTETAALLTGTGYRVPYEVGG